MEHQDFQVGKSFWTGSGEWVCVDKGTIYIIAVQAKYYLALNRYAPDIALTVFEPVDFGGCRLEDSFKHRSR